MRWTGQRVLVVGAARQGCAMARYLAQHGAQVVLNDRRPAEALEEARKSLADLPLSWATGGHPLDLLDGVEGVFLSGGVPLDLPLVAEARRRGIPLATDAQLFLEVAPCPVVGITGSAGKTTTTTLLGRMASTCAAQPAFEGLPRVGTPRFRRVWVGGNIGTPLMAFADALQPDDLAVVELSSFQLELVTRAPQVAAVLNLTPNHLDRHKTMEAYAAAKARILDFQQPHDQAVLCREDTGSWGLRARVQGRLWAFGLHQAGDDLPGAYFRAPWVMLRTPQGEQPVMERETIRLRGEHNLMNVLAACTLAAALGLEPAAMRAGVAGFGGVPHRLEFVRRWRGVDWYNDSIATAPERSMAAIRSFQEPLVLLAGGRDKHLPWDGFARLVRRRVDHLVLFGEAAENIRRAVEAVPGERPYTLHLCPDLESAVQTAAQVAEPGDVVLLSPGGTSFDAFRDFEERGEQFRAWVNALP